MQNVMLGIASSPSQDQCSFLQQKIQQDLLSEKERLVLLQNLLSTPLQIPHESQDTKLVWEGEKLLLDNIGLQWLESDML